MDDVLRGEAPDGAHSELATVSCKSLVASHSLVVPTKLAIPVRTDVRGTIRNRQAAMLTPARARAALRGQSLP
jgi:hypothetical protein